jgi:hypothetical protein
MHPRFPSPVLALALTLFAVTARADTSATLPTAINLPRGPASLEGFGQGYDLSPASGLPSLSYALEVPPGRAGLVPELALHHNAGEGAGALGLGWSLGLPAIERSLRRGIPDYSAAPTWTLKGLGGGEELVEIEPASTASASNRARLSWSVTCRAARCQRSPRTAPATCSA